MSSVVPARRLAAGVPAVLLCLALNAVPASANILTVSADIVGVEHDFISGTQVIDRLILAPNSTYADLSQYNAFKFSYSVPQGDEITVTPPPGVNYYGYFIGDLLDGVPLPTAANVTLTLDNFSGNHGTPVFATTEASAAAGIDATIEHEYTGSITFTGLSITVSGINPADIPTGFATYKSDGSYFYYDTALTNDPGGFVNDPPTTPEPGALALLTGCVGAFLLQRRRIR